MRNNHQKSDKALVEAMGRALDAEFRGEPKQWFVQPENPRSRLKLRIGMFNPGLCTVAEMFYHGEPSESIRSKANLIVAAVNSAYAVNSHDPFTAAQFYPRFVTVIRRLVTEAWRYDGGIESEGPVDQVSVETLEVMRELLSVLTGRRRE